MYATNEEYKRRYPNTELSESEIELDIITISKIAEEYCNTRFVPTPDTYKLDFVRKFYTKKAPLLSVSSMTVHKSILEEDLEFYVYNENRLIEIDEELEPPDKMKKAISVQYSYGYETVPIVVKEVILDLINLNDEIAKGELSNVTYQSESWDNEYTRARATGEENSTAGIRKSILSRLDPYKVLDISYLSALDFENGKGNVRAMLL